MQIRIMSIFPPGYGNH